MLLLLLLLLLFFSLLLFEWFTVHHICVRLTSKDLLSTIGSINTCVPNVSPPSLSSSLLMSIVIWTIRIVAACSQLLCVWFRPPLTVLGSITYNHSACLSSFCVCLYAIFSFEYLTWSFIMYLRYIHSCFLCRRVLAVISFKMIIFFIITVVFSVATVVLCVAYWYVDSSDIL